MSTGGEFMADMPRQVEVNHVQTEIIVTDGVGPLSKADVRQLVTLVLENLRHEQDLNEQRTKDTTIENQVFPPQER